MKGYQGIQKDHGNSQWPLKKPRDDQLTGEAKAGDQALARERIGMEHMYRLQNLQHLGGMFRTLDTTGSKPYFYGFIMPRPDC
ncbi:MAG: hypothetical protein ACFB12_19155 [Leptolyngbyaceae cyanobacterium]